MSFGGPRPQTRKLLVSIDNCSNIISNFEKQSFSSNVTSTESSTTLVQDLNYTNNEGEDDKYFYLYRISYTWYAFIGFALTVCIGAFTSSLYSKFYYKNRRSRTVEEQEEYFDADLFITPIRNRLLEKQGLPKNQNDKISCNSRIDNDHISFHELKIQE